MKWRRRLPKRDPLATALAEGRTPSPEIVANAAAEGSLAPAVATALAGGDRARRGRRRRPGEPGDHQRPRTSETLAATPWPPGRGRFLNRLDCDDIPADERYGFYYDYDYLNYTVKTDSTAGRWRALATGQSPAVGFWFRQSPQYLVASGMSPRLYPGRVTAADPATVAARDGKRDSGSERSARLSSLAYPIGSGQPVPRRVK